jgi:transposase InsO family protein
MAQQVVECCAWDRLPPRFLIHDRHSRYGAAFDRRLRHLGIEQVRTPFKAPRANAISERWVKSVRTECLDICWSSTRLICVEPYQRMSCILIIGVRIDHWVSARPASPLCVSFDLEGPTARSPRSLSSVDCITSIGVLHDGRHFCALQAEMRRIIPIMVRRYQEKR